MLGIWSHNTDHNIGNYCGPSSRDARGRKGEADLAPFLLADGDLGLFEALSAALATPGSWVLLASVATKKRKLLSQGIDFSLKRRKAGLTTKPLQD